MLAYVKAGTRQNDFCARCRIQVHFNPQASKPNPKEHKKNMPFLYISRLTRMGLILLQNHPN